MLKMAGDLRPGDVAQACGGFRVLDKVELRGQIVRLDFEDGVRVIKGVLQEVEVQDQDTQTQ